MDSKEVFPNANLMLITFFIYNSCTEKAETGTNALIKCARKKKKKTLVDAKPTNKHIIAC